MKALVADGLRPKCVASDCVVGAVCVDTQCVVLPCDSDDNCPKGHACRTFFDDQTSRVVDKRCVADGDDANSTLKRLSKSNQVLPKTYFCSTN